MTLNTKPRKLKPNSRIFFNVFLILSAYVLYPQEQQSASTENPDTIYVIREVQFDITGRTRPFALIYNGEFTEGERLTGKENLDKYITLKRQLLLNQQVLEDVSIEYSQGETEEDGAIPVKLIVHVKDSWNLILLPYPKYDSNDGFSITIKARDYNFFGTMSPLMVDLGYLQKDGDDTIAFSIESDIPFQAMGLHWDFSFDNFFEYTFGKPLFYQNVTGLSAQLPWQTTTFTVGLRQYFTLNEDNVEEDKDIYSLDDRFLGAYGSTELFASWKIPLGIEVGDFGELAYIPGVKAKINYPYGNMDDPRKPVGTVSHLIGFGRIDWIGNYRKGLAFSVENTYSWFVDRSDAPLKIVLDFDAIFHWPFSKYFGLSSRLKYIQFWHWSDRLSDFIPNYSSGEYLRGVLDKDIRADYLLSFNLDFPIRLLRFWPSELFNNPKLHLFDFEMHLSPFTDLAFIHGPYSKLKDINNPYEGSTNFTLDDMINTAGFEIIFFSGFFRSLKLRLSVGYNVQKILDDGLTLKLGFFPAWDEIFIGLDHFY